MWNAVQYKQKKWLTWAFAFKAKKIEQYPLSIIILIGIHTWAGNVNMYETKLNKGV